MKDEFPTRNQCFQPLQVLYGGQSFFRRQKFSSGN